MKTEYNILWIDDNFRLVRGDVRNLTTHLKKEEISLNVIDFNPEAGTKITEEPKFISSFEQYELDFILVDYNMPELDGVEVIAHVRKVLNDYHTPIVFYSNEENIDLTDLINNENKGVAFDEYLDGVFFCHRDYITRKMTNLIDSQLKREGKISAVRGMLMEKVSDIDVLVFEVLKKLSLDVDESKHNKLSTFINEKLSRRERSAGRVVQDVSVMNYPDMINYIVENPRITDSHFRSELLRKVLDNIDNKKQHGNILSDFYNVKDGNLSLNCFRNRYAHQTEVELSDIHTPENCLRIKSESKRHKENLSESIS
ncbi:response regulator [Vibrio sp. T187]|uniref:response regulator n=1 Tax=Vibrio TaxID=662 RepID=UPI0010C9EB88|nr:MULTISPECIES: response regulator [Vibrio]MBW3697965.1 response regulator [Vibrio sp. T187]